MSWGFRVFSFVFHLALGVFLVATVAIAAKSHQSMNLDMLPFSDEHLLRSTLLLGIVGIVCSLLALTRSFRFLFLIWAAMVAYLITKWFFFNDYEFDNVRHYRWAIVVTYSAAFALLGAALMTRSRKSIATP